VAGFREIPPRPELRAHGPPPSLKYRSAARPFSVSLPTTERAGMRASITSAGARRPLAPRGPPGPVRVIVRAAGRAPKRILQAARMPFERVWCAKAYGARPSRASDPAIGADDQRQCRARGRNFATHEAPRRLNNSRRSDSPFERKRADAAWRAPLRRMPRRSIFPRAVPRDLGLPPNARGVCRRSLARPSV